MFKFTFLFIVREYVMHEVNYYPNNVDNMISKRNVLVTDKCYAINVILAFSCAIKRYHVKIKQFAYSGDMNNEQLKRQHKQFIMRA